MKRNTRKDLDDLRRSNRDGTALKERRTAKNRPPDPRETLCVPAPLDRCTYTRAEIAAMLGIKTESVSNLGIQGRIGADGQRVLLQPLRCPRKRYAPSDVLAFFSAVNGRKVEILA